MLADTVRTTVARWLEEGLMSGSCARAVARVHGAIATRAIARPLALPAGEPSLVTVTVGGSTLGGSGKTRVALMCVRELAEAGLDVTLIGHGYRGRAPLARVVSATDALADVGDEALACARALARSRYRGAVRVVIGPTRQAAFDLATSLSPRAQAVVFDGPLQLAPVRSTLSILAVDADAPWGAGDVAPAGDLRAPRRALLAHADHIAYVDATPRGATLRDGRALDLTSLASSLAASSSAHAWPRIGLFTAIARPERLVTALSRLGLTPAILVRAADHGPMTPELERRIEDADVDLWLATPKCAMHLESVALEHPLAILDESTVLAPPLLQALAETAEQTTVRVRGVGNSHTCMA